MTPRPLRGFRRGAAEPDARVLPLAGESSLAVDADELRRRIGGWVATQPASERPGLDTIWREALLVADRIVSLARAGLGTGGAPPWLVDVRLPGDAHELAQAAGLPTRVLHRAVDALIAAEVLDGASQIGSERVVRIRPDALTDAPVLAAVRWDVVRELLGEADAPIARLVVRELARRTTVEARRHGHFVSASQRDLAEAAGYSKASMRRHLDALVTAGAIASRSRDRANSWHRLQPVVFDGGSGVEPTGTSLRPGRDRSPVSSHAPERAPRAAGRVPPLPLRAPPSAGRDARPPAAASPERSTPVEAALMLEVNGVRIALPPGVELTLEEDPQGAIWYRAGAVRLGPVRFT